MENVYVTDRTLLLTPAILLASISHPSARHPVTLSTDSGSGLRTLWALRGQDLSVMFVHPSTLTSTRDIVNARSMLIEEIDMDWCAGEDRFETSSQMGAR